MGFELIEHVANNVKTTGAKEGLDFRAYAIEDLFNSILHTELHVKQNAEELEIITFTSSWVDNNGMFFQRVEHNSVPRAPFVHFSASDCHISFNGQVVQGQRELLEHTEVISKYDSFASVA